MYFISKENRDAAFNAAGGKKAGLKTHTCNNSVMTEAYVKDFQEIKGREPRTGLKGGDVLFPRLYTFTR